METSSSSTVLSTDGSLGGGERDGHVAQSEALEARPCSWDLSFPELFSEASYEVVQKP